MAKSAKPAASAKKSTAKVDRKKARTTANKKKTSLSETDALREKNVKAHLRAAKTRTAYDGHVRRGQEWIEQYAGDVDDHMADGEARTQKEDIYMDPDFKIALDGKPTEYSNHALSLFISYKCFFENLGQATSEGIYSAFKMMWDQYDGDKYRGKWFYHEGKNEWLGNPATSSEVQTTLTSVKNKNGAEGGDRNHSLAMSKEHMEKIMAWSERMYPAESYNEKITDLNVRTQMMRHLEFRAFASTAWTIWSRNFELVRLQRKHIVFNLQSPAPAYEGHFEIHLNNRKGWQAKIDKKNKEGDLQGNKFQIYKQGDIPSFDPYLMLPRWIHLLEQHYDRALEPDDFIFPAISTNGIIQPREPISHDAIQAMIHEAVQGAKIPQACGGTFSTHCFRRGGAQYRFMFAPFGQRWTLQRVRWWGGWAEGEQRNTLIRYLLDELMLTERDHSDALCPVQREVNESLLGEHALLRPASAEELRLLHTSLSSRVSAVQDNVNEVKMSVGHIVGLFANICNFPPGLTRVAENSLSGSQLAVPAVSRVHIPRTSVHQQYYPHSVLTGPASMSTHSGQTWYSPPPVTYQHAQPPLPLPAFPQTPSAQRALPTEGLLIPDVPVRLPDGTRTPRSESWRIIVKHWNHGAPDLGLVMPLKDWPSDYLQGRNKPLFAMKYHQRFIIANEYINVHNSDEESFLAAFPEAEDGHTSLQKAIQRARLQRGDAKGRR